MSTTFQLDTSTSRANPTPSPMKRLTIPAIRQRKKDGVTAQPIVMLTAYTARQAQLLDEHCDLLLVGDSLGQVIYGLPSSVPVTLDMMAAHGAAVVRGSFHAAVVVDMPFGSYEASPQQAFASAARLLKETGCAAVKLEGGAAMAETVAFLTARGIPVMGHVGLTPQAVNVLGGYNARGRSEAEAEKIISATPRRSTRPGPSRSSSRAWWNRSRSQRPGRSPARPSALALRPSATDRCW
jgi:3-methyl-2-oxobutanoate hydroxymethyltransferase